MAQISTKTDDQKPNIAVLIADLKALPESVWCDYLFNRDLLVARIGPEKRAELIAGAIKCGTDLAQETARSYGSIPASELVDQLPLQVKPEDSQTIQKQVFLATFTEPNEIKIYQEPINKLTALKLPGFDRAAITEIILAHELFHYFESQDDQFYSRTSQIELWHLGRYHHRSTVRATSEIAAMIFSWRLNDLSFSPLILDILMLYCYNPEAAHDCYQELLALARSGQGDPESDQ
ncbi:hypothetical protein [Lapidilactobacillus luobeiensis]|uniref:hypothetical protein n=1 Tax=Lapidilactobacillus luobeiensis TaxID=2950371 RepID=UPI0021C2994D|nr:hypothetical protein [Lapidilactobacillus luobeiensis]